MNKQLLTTILLSMLVVSCAGAPSLSSSTSISPSTNSSITQTNTSSNSPSSSSGSSTPTTSSSSSVPTASNSSSSSSSFSTSVESSMTEELPNFSIPSNIDYSLNKESSRDALEQVSTANYNPDVLKELGLEQNNYFKKPSDTKNLPPQSRGYNKLNSNFNNITEFDLNKKHKVNFDYELQFIDFMTTSAEFLLNDSEEIILTTNTVYKKQNKQYYLQYNSEFQDSRLLIKINDNSSSQGISFWTLRVVIDNDIPTLEIQMRHDFPHQNGQVLWQKGYLKIRPAESYSYYREGSDWMNNELVINTSVWEISKAEDSIIAIGRHEHHPNNSYQVQNYIFYPTYAVLIYGDQYSTNFMIFTSDGGLFLQSFIQENPIPVRISIGSYVGWGPIRVSSGNLGLKHALDITVKGETYEISTYGFNRINVIENVDLVGMGTSIAADGSVNDISLEFNIKSPLNSDVLLGLKAMEALGFTLNLPNLNFDDFALTSQAIAESYQTILSNIKFLGYPAHFNQQIFITNKNGPFTNLMITDSFITWFLNLIEESYQYTITFYVDGGTPIEPIQFKYNDSIILPEDPVKEGYDFEGWYIDEALTIPFDLTIMPAENLVLYAKYEFLENID